MRQIHHVAITWQDRWVLDPDAGAVKRREMVMKRSTVGRIVHAKETYDQEPDGTFSVSDECANFYLRQPGWHEGESPFPAEEASPSPEKLAAPKVASKS